jgi:23S rRNA pseudouridine2605 synthase
MVREGRVAVNGKIITELPILIDPQKDRVEVDSERVPLGTPAVRRRLYLLLNKPKGVYCTNVAQGEQLRAIDLLGPDLPARVYPVGRLDSESRGLLLMTNDGELTNQLTHPRYGVAKTYRAVVDGDIDAAGLERLQHGVWLSDQRSGSASKTGRSYIRIVRRSPQSTILEITIREGRNRQVRRMLADVGHKVRDLMRIKMGPLDLRGLSSGAFRPLTPREVRQLKELATEHVEPTAPARNAPSSARPAAKSPRSEDARRMYAKPVSAKPAKPNPRSEPLFRPADDE